MNNTLATKNNVSFNWLILQFQLCRLDTNEDLELLFTPVEVIIGMKNLKSFEATGQDGLPTLT